MKLAERLDKAWSARRSSAVIDRAMRFAPEGLILGAGTILARAATRGRNTSINLGEPRLLALLTAAHWRVPETTSLVHLQKAAERWTQGEQVLASTHLAMSGLDRLKSPEADAHRLFLADELMKAGFEPSVVISAVTSRDSAFARAYTYDPNQPRVAAGNGRTSGQWTSAGGDSATTTAADAPPRHLGLPIIQVTPPTLIGAAQPVTSVHACDTAQVECVNEALRASRYDRNPVPRTIDVGNCMGAGLACDTLSWVVEDTPLMRYAGVIFPHGGVVIIVHGQLDRYYRPKPDGSNPLR